MAYLGWQAAIMQKFGKSNGVQLTWIFTCAALPGVTFSLLDKDWLVGSAIGALATGRVGPAVYDKTSEILRNNSVGITQGSKIVKAAQASAYVACLTAVFLLHDPERPKDSLTNIEIQEISLE